MNPDGHGVNPFPGLRPFDEQDEVLFFGRDAQVDDLMRRLRERRFIAVVGTSGSGKSSLVRAGLLPALHGGFMAGAGSRWQVAVMRPGNAPNANLARALDRLGVLGGDETPPEVRVGLARAVLDRGARGLIDVLNESSIGPNDRVLILVDQFEELFRFRQSDPDDAAAFVKLLMAAADDDRQIYVVVTMRSDFLGECSKFGGLAEKINDGLFLVPRMEWDQLRRVIEGPVGVAGASVTPSLVTRLLNDLGDNEDQLPVLQHALMRTWGLRPSGAGPVLLDNADYERTGGLERALSLHGDEVLAEVNRTLGERGLEVTEKLFRAITELGTDNRGIRRPTSIAELRAITGASFDELVAVIGQFRAPNCSFLTPAGGVLTDDSVIDITHESLMRTWMQLEKWVEAESQSAQQYRRLATAAVLHAEGKAALWRDPDLQFAETWRETVQPTAAWGAQVDRRLDFSGAMDFLDRSIQERGRERAMRTRRNRLAVGALTAIVIVLAAITGLALQQRADAVAQRVEAEVQHLADLSRQRPAGDDLGAMWAVEAYDTSPGNSAAAGAMLYHLQHFEGLFETKITNWQFGVFADYGRRLGIVTGDPTADQAHVGPSTLLSFRTSDLAVATLSRTVNATMACGFRTNSTALFANARELTLRDLGDGSVRSVPANLTGISAVACLPDGHTVLVAAKGVVTAIDTRNGIKRRIAILRDRTATGIRVSNTGAYFATASPAGMELFTYPAGRSLFHTALSGERQCGDDTSTTCQSVVSFSDDDKSIAWCAETTDSSGIALASIASLPRKQFMPVDCSARASLNFHGRGVPWVVIPGDTFIWYPDRKKYQESYAYRLEAVPPGPLWNEDMAIFATPDRAGLATRSLADRNAPQLGAEPAPQWPEDYTLTGSILVAPGKIKPIHRYDLTRFRTQLDEADDRSYTRRWRYSGDESHAVSLDYPTGRLEVLETTSSGTSVIGTFHVPAVGLDKDDHYTERPEIAYDPTRRVVTYLGKAGIRVFSLDKGELSAVESAFSAEMQHEFGDSWIENTRGLTPRGNYVHVMPKGGAALWSVDGKQRINDVSTEAYISADERYVIYEHDVHTLPDWTAGEPLQTNIYPPMALSADHSLLAFKRDGDKADQNAIVLYDFKNRTEVAVLPWGKPHIEDMTFSADGKFLIVRNTNEDWVNYVAYSVDPHDWKRRLCLADGRPFEPGEMHAINGALADPSPCREFAAQMVPQPSPSPSPSSTPNPAVKATKIGH